MLLHGHHPVLSLRRVLLPCLLLLALIAGMAASAPGAATAKPPETRQLGAVTGGASGTSYSFAQSFGSLQVPYIIDTDHFNKPGGLYIDGGDQLFVSEEAGHRVLRFDLNNPGSVFSYGDPTMPWHHYKFLYHAQEVITDGAGNLWVAIPHAIKKLDSNGELVVMLPNADTGDPWNSGSDDGHFNNPFGLALDSTGRLFVADRDNHRIQIFDVTGNTINYLATIGESGVEGSDDAHFAFPTRIAFDSLDRLYVQDGNNARIQRCEYNPVSTTWECSTFFGVTGEAGQDLTHLNLYGYGLKIVGNTIFIGDSYNARVLKCDLAAVCAHFAGTTGVFGADNSTFQWISDVEVDSAGNVYVSDINNHRVQKFNSAGVYQTTLGVTQAPYLTGEDYYNRPWGIATGVDGSIYILENSGFRLIKMNAAGVQQWTVGVPGVFGDDNQHFSSHWSGVEGSPAVDATGRVYVPDTSNQRVQVFNSNGSYYATMGVTGVGDGDNAHFNCPAGVAINPVNGDILVSDHCAHRIQVFNSSRVYKTTLGETFVSGDDNQHFNGQYGIAVDGLGNVYVADTENQRVQKCTYSTTSYACATFAGTGIAGRAYDQMHPFAVTVDQAGRVFVADEWEGRVLVFGSAGQFLTSLGGSCGGNNAELCSPSGVAVDRNDNVYVTDRDNQRIQKFSLGVDGWQQSNLNGFADPDNGYAAALEVFNGKLYAGATNWNTGATVWSSTDGKTWAQTSQVGFDGVQTAANPMIGDFQVFNGQLYAGTRWGSEDGQIWRTANGSDWNQVSESGFPGVGAFALFGNYLYAGTFTRSDTSGAEIWRSDTGSTGDWEHVATPALTGDPENVAVTAMLAYDGNLYAGLRNLATGSQVWRSANGSDWAPMDLDGFGDNASNGGINSMAVFNDLLYASTGNCDAGGQVWRTDGGAWTQVVDGGFGDLYNCSIDGLFVFGPYLYAATENHPWNWDYTGVEVWRTLDGVNWSQVNPDGFGDANNKSNQYNSASVTAFRGSLYVGVSNWASGVEIWRMDHRLYLPLIVR